MTYYYVGVDVGSGSVRAGLMSPVGKVLATAKEEIAVHNPKPDHYEQSSNQIWNAICICVKSVCREVNKESIRAIGFDATCSLVLINANNGATIGVSEDGKDEWDTIMWMDHRASLETSKINQTVIKEALRSVGGQISIEMQIPKLLWLQKNRAKSFEKATHFLDLADFLTFKATNKDVRSVCTTTCKWTYDPSHIENEPKEENQRFFEAKGWNKDFFDDINLKFDINKFGKFVARPGTNLGFLSPNAAFDLGLTTETTVAAALIDAHAGALAMIACSQARGLGGMTEQLGLICGTSSCHMVLQENQTFIKGIWGPYESAILPKLFLLEAGQSAVGCLIDKIVLKHPAADELPKDDVYGALERHLAKMAEKKGLDKVALLTSNLHVTPDFHGNRSPLSDANLRGAMMGLSLNDDLDDLALNYLATIQALALGTRHIVDHLSRHEVVIRVAVMCGGLSQSPLFVQSHADALGLPVVLPMENECMIRGAAMAAALADLPMADLECDGNLVWPDYEVNDFFGKKYEVFRQMIQDQIKYRDIMQNQ